MIVGPYNYTVEESNDFEPANFTLIFQNLENGWQGSKVYTCELSDPSDNMSDPNIEFFETRKKLWADKKGHRRKQFGKKTNRNIPCYSWWKGEKLSYVDARKKIYCPIYSQLVQQTDSYQKLKQLVDDGTNIQILDYDGFDFEDESLKDIVNDPNRVFGHGLVLVALLRGETPWSE